MAIDPRTTVLGFVEGDGLRHVVFGTRRTDGGVAWGRYGQCGTKLSWPVEDPARYATCLKCAAWVPRWLR